MVLSGWEIAHLFLQKYKFHVTGESSGLTLTCSPYLTSHSPEISECTSATNEKGIKSHLSRKKLNREWIEIYNLGRLKARTKICFGVILEMIEFQFILTYAIRLKLSDKVKKNQEKDRIRAEGNLNRSKNRSEKNRKGPNPGSNRRPLTIWM
jgi:hypothetical protein